MKEETCIQKSFFRTGFPLLGAAVAVLALCLYLLFHGLPPLPAALLLAAGIALIVRGVGSGKRESERILRFIRDQSAFRHRLEPPLTMAALLDRLRQEGFAVTEYPFGNCHGYREFAPKCVCHFFLSNNDAPGPDLQEDGGYAALFVQAHLSASMTCGQQYLVNLKYGPGLEEKSAAYIRASREGFIHDKHGNLFGFHLAWDTRENVLYCAEAVRRVVWQRGDRFGAYAGGLLGRLFFG